MTRSESTAGDRRRHARHRIRRLPADQRGIGPAAGAAPGGGGERPAREDRRRARALRGPRGDGPDGLEGRAAGAPHVAAPPTGIRAMDEQGIDVEALSINPYWYAADRDVARELIRIQNEKLAEACAANPDRFVAFASVALQHPDLAAEQLEDGVQASTACAARGIGGSVNGEELADPKFHPFWAKAEQLGVLVFIHPQATGVAAESAASPEGQRRARQHDRQPARDHDRALAPDLRGHARPLPRPQDLRGARRRLPAVVRGRAPTRSARPSPTATRRRSGRSRPSTSGSSTSTRSSSRPRRCATWSPRPARARSSWAPTTRSRGRSTSVDHILDTPGLSDAERVAMLGDTAAKLLGITA